jgi:hypothetical protein
VSERRDPRHPGEWTPATSEPGEILTPMGQIDQMGHFLRAFKHRDPRNVKYRRQMWRTGLMMAGLGLAIIAAIAAANALLGLIR